ncbi:CaiB/BaiF CoA transferase family protein [Sphingobium baderi]|nr:CoA transferase [Sphingobium baderi]
MTQVMKGVRILEVAQFAFVPVAAAVLADWGADVIKIEHPIRGDTQRGFLKLESCPVNPDRNIMVQHPNRGKRSVGIDIATEAGQKLIYELAATCDVFLTNYLPDQRQKLKIDVEHIRSANPKIIYARGSALGDKGDERNKGGFDATAFWARMGSASAVTPPELSGPLTQPGPAYGDTIGGMNIAGGIAAALFHRSQTGEAIELDVSLLSSGAWATAMSIGLALENDAVPFEAKMPASGSVKGNPFVGVFRTADGEYINITILTPGPLIEDTFTHLGIAEMARDDKFSTAEALMTNWAEASGHIVAAIGSKPFSYWVEHLKTLRGQWAPYQNLLAAGNDPQLIANGLVIDIETDDGRPPIKLVSSPVQFNHMPIVTTRAPEAGEHTETVLMELGMEWEKLEALKEAKVIC